MPTPAVFLKASDLHMASTQPSPAPLTEHRLFTITPNDHRGQIWTVSLLFGIFSVLVLGLRGATGHGNLGADDWTAAAATLLALGQLGTILSAASKGLGQIDSNGYGLQVGRLLRWELIAVFDSITEIGIFIPVWALVRPLQMDIRRKAYVGMAFSLRLPIIVFAVLNVIYIHRFLDSTKPTVAIANAVMMQQVELSYSLISSSFARFIPFLKKFGTGMGLGLAPEIYASGTGNYKGNHELSYLRKRSKPATETGDTELLRLTTGNGGSTSMTSHPKSKSPSLEDESQRMGIRRDYHIRVSYEDAAERVDHAGMKR